MSKPKRAGRKNKIGKNGSTIEAKSPLTQKRLNEIFEYDLNTGLLYWKGRDESCFPSKRTHAWCAHQVRQRIPVSGANSDGHIQVTVHAKNTDGSFYSKRYLASRIIWHMIYGEWPKSILDHKNGDNTDNRIENLRLSTFIENGRNGSYGRNNTSGCVGVSETSKGVYIAYIGRKNTPTYEYLGTFTDFEEAVKVRLLAEKRQKYDPRHGAEVLLKTFPKDREVKDPVLKVLIEEKRKYFAGLCRRPRYLDIRKYNGFIEVGGNGDSPNSLTWGYLPDGTPGSWYGAGDNPQRIWCLYLKDLRLHKTVGIIKQETRCGKWYWRDPDTGSWEIITV